MRPSPSKDLLILVILSVLLIIIIAVFPQSDLRTVLGIIFIVVFPGYSLVSAAFPRKDDISGFERLALTLGLSVAVVSLIGIMYNYAPWGITLNPMLYSLFAFSLLMSAISWYRRERLPSHERFSFEIVLRLPLHRDGTTFSRMLSVALVVAIFATTGVFAYAIASFKSGEQYTTFYVLGSQGKLEDYPTELTVGQEARVILGIENHERRAMDYRIEVRLEGNRIRQITPVDLDIGAKWNQEFKFTANKAGTQQRLDFLLYRAEDNEAYRDAHLYINVQPG